MPDIYQGNETWDLSLVDPDNRRPVDYKRRREMLDSLAKAKPAELLENWPDGRIKMFLTERLLRFRYQHVDLFRRGNYVPVRAAGSLADCCISFVRELDEEWLLVIAPRLSSRVGFPPTGERWKGTTLEIPPSLSLGSVRELFTGRTIRLDGHRLSLADALSILPFAVVTNCR